MRKFIISAAIVLTAVTLTACDPGSDATAPPSSNTNTTVDQGAGSKDATADIKIGKVLHKDSLGLPYADITVTNNSEKTSDYYITVTLNSSDGTEQLDDSVAFVDGLKPGQVKKDRLNFIGVNPDNFPKNAVITLETVQRTAS